MTPPAPPAPRRDWISAAFLDLLRISPKGCLGRAVFWVGVQFHASSPPVQPLVRGLNLVVSGTNGRQVARVIRAAVRLWHHMVNNVRGGVCPLAQAGQAKVSITLQDSFPQLIPCRTIPALMPGQPSLISLPSRNAVSLAQAGLVIGQSTATARMAAWLHPSWRHGHSTIRAARCCYGHRCKALALGGKVNQCLRMLPVSSNEAGATSKRCTTPT